MAFTPKPPAQTSIPPSAHPPTLGSVAASQSVAKRAQKASGKGRGDTVKTSMQGIEQSPSTAKSTLLG